MSDDALTRLLPALRAIPAAKVRRTTIPVSVVLGEAYGIVAAATQHRAALVAVGVAPELIDSLAARANALGAAQVAFLASRAERPATARKALFREATKLRSDLVAAVHFALRDQPDERKHAPKLRGTPRTAYLCQDLRDVAALIDDNRAAFGAIGFDFGAVDRANALSEELLMASSEARVRSATHEGRAIRDRAYSFLTEATAEIRRAARFAFRGDPDDRRRSVFASNYSSSKKTIKPVDDSDDSLSEIHDAAIS